ncbi:MAG: T9SS type A sorting domain-containing protein [Bacteroidia bacterium]|nr:T9SS type A sorting domain-containing protein [Bacteroidia bacterium]
MKGFPTFYFPLIIGVLFCVNKIVAQHRSDVWCFGHWAAINFSGPVPVPDTSALITRGSCASICSASGQLLFYIANDSSTLLWDRGVIYNSNHTLMMNGDSIAGKAWYQEHAIIPDPADSNLYYTFNSCPTPVYGFYYSKINMTLNGGLGAVVQKNVQLQSFRTADCITAIKHGNGRDWWVLFRKNSSPSTNEIYEYLITPNGISNTIILTAGSVSTAGFAKFCVSNQGDKIGLVNAAGLIEVYYFNRCNGLIDSVRTLEPELPSPPYPWYWECEFSPNSNLLYVTTSDSSCLLLQYNLSDSNPSLTRDTLQFTNYPIATLGAVRLAPDNRIYVANAYYNTVTSNYPYPDTMYNVYNTYLSVINHPDSVGTACDYQPYSFYLGGKRCYKGLPNNPDYDLGPLTGSICDTLTTGIAPQPQTAGVATLQTTYIHTWQKLFVNAQQVKGKNALLMLYDIQGKEVYRLRKGHASGAGGYYTQDVDISSLSNGLYIVTLVTDKEVLSARFVKN